MDKPGPIVEMLGGRKVLGARVSSLDALRREVRNGLPVGSLDALAERLDLAAREVEAAIQVPGRTLARRKRERRFRADESDRLYRLARIGALAVRALGSEEKAATWLHRPNRALGGEPPLSLLDTGIGARQVEDLLGRIEHGVPS